MDNLEPFGIPGIVKTPEAIQRENAPARRPTPKSSEKTNQKAKPIFKQLSKPQKDPSK